MIDISVMYFVHYRDVDLPFPFTAPHCITPFVEDFPRTPLVYRDDVALLTCGGQATPPTYWFHWLVVVRWPWVVFTRTMSTSGVVVLNIVIPHPTVVDLRILSQYVP